MHGVKEYFIYGKDPSIYKYQGYKKARKSFKIPDKLELLAASLDLEFRIEVHTHIINETMLFAVDGPVESVKEFMRLAQQIDA